MWAQARTRIIEKGVIIKKAEKHMYAISVFDVCVPPKQHQQDRQKAKNVVSSRAVELTFFSDCTNKMRMRLTD